MRGWLIRIFGALAVFAATTAPALASIDDDWAAMHAKGNITCKDLTNFSNRHGREHRYAGQVAKLRSKKCGQPIAKPERTRQPGQSQSGIAVPQRPTPPVARSTATRPETSLKKGERLATLGGDNYDQGYYLTAQANFMDSCNLGVAKGCAGLSYTYLDPEDKYEGRNVKLAQQMAGKACNLSFQAPEFCGFAWQTHYFTDDGQYDFKAGRQFYELSRMTDKDVVCTADFDTDECVFLGIAYTNPEWGTPNYPRGRNFMLRACTAGNGEGCSSLGFTYVNTDQTTFGEPSNVTGRSYFIRSCELGFLPGCEHARATSAIGRFFANGMPSITDSRRYFEKGGKDINSVKCSDDTELAETCLLLARNYRDTYHLGDLSLAVQLFEKACDGGSMQSCLELGRLYVKGGSSPNLVIKPNYAEARKWMEIACNAQHPSACSEYRAIYYK